MISSLGKLCSIATLDKKDGSSIGCTTSESIKRYLSNEFNKRDQ
ncbi:MULTISPECIES: hypothetical protein [Methanobacterium]|nr:MULTISPECIES: hypothetical protein [Methanobacterium]